MCALRCSRRWGHGVLSLLVSVVRQLMVLLPVAFLLSRASGLAAVWWAFPTAELFSLTLSTVFLRRVYLREIKFLASHSSRTQHWKTQPTEAHFRAAVGCFYISAGWQAGEMAGLVRFPAYFS